MSKCFWELFVFSKAHLSPSIQCTVVVPYLGGAREVANIHHGANNCTININYLQIMSLLAEHACQLLIVMTCQIIIDVHLQYLNSCCNLVCDSFPFTMMGVTRQCFVNAMQLFSCLIFLQKKILLSVLEVY